MTATPVYFKIKGKTLVCKGSNFFLQCLSNTEPQQLWPQQPVQRIKSQWKRQSPRSCQMVLYLQGLQRIGAWGDDPECPWSRAVGAEFKNQLQLPEPKAPGSNQVKLLRSNSVWLSLGFRISYMCFIVRISNDLRFSALYRLKQQAADKVH